MYEYDNHLQRDYENDKENLEEIENSDNNQLSNPENELNLTNLHLEYDECINELKKQLTIAKELRKKSEIDKKTLEHRIFLLKNQEKYVLLQFQNTKKKVEQILKNRTKAKEKMKQNCSRRRLKNSRTLSSDFGVGVKSNSQIENEKDNYVDVKKIQKCDPTYEEREKMKNELLQKLKEDEAERLRLENEIANIEKEEFRMMRMFNTEKSNP